MNFQKLGMITLTVAAVAIASAEDAKSVMQKMAAEFDKAMVAKDIKWFEKVAAADYHEKDASGKTVDRKTAMAMKAGVLRIPSPRNIFSFVFGNPSEVEFQCL